MPSSTSFMPGIYHDWENKEIKEFNFLSTKERQVSFFMSKLAFSNCQACDNYMSKRPVNKVCLRDNGVWGYMCMQLHAIPGQAWYPIIKRGFLDRLGTSKVIHKL